MRLLQIVAIGLIGCCTRIGLQKVSRVHEGKEIRWDAALAVTAVAGLLLKGQHGRHGFVALHHGLWEKTEKGH